MCRRTIRGWFTGGPSDRGRAGIRILGSGGVARICHLESASALVSSEVTDGAGAIGVSIGTTTTQFITTRGITRTVLLFITAITSTAAQRCMAEQTFTRQTDHREPSGMAAFITVREQRPIRSRETTTRHEDTQPLEPRLAHTPVVLLDTLMAGKRRVIHRVEAPALVAVAADSTAAVVVAAGRTAVADIGKPKLKIVTACKFRTGEKSYVADEVATQEFRSQEIYQGCGRKCPLDGLPGGGFAGAREGAEDVFVGGRSQPSAGDRAAE